MIFLSQHRRLLYDLFTKNYRVRRNMVQAKLTQEFGDVSKAEIDRLLNVRWTTRLNLSALNELFVFCLWSNVSSVVTGVLQLPCRDVVPQGNGAFLTVRARPLRPMSANQILSQVSSGRAVRQTDESQSQLAQFWGWVIGEQIYPPSALLRTWSFLISTEAFLTLTRAPGRRAEERNSSHTLTHSWSVRGVNYGS